MKTLEQLIPAYLANLQEQGKTERTMYTYGKDCEQIQAFFGPDKKLNNILPAHVSKFYKSDELLRLSNGRDRAPATVNKTLRVFKALMEFALERGCIQALPLPKSQ